jgi:predicted nucleic-acid-binding protein
MAAAATRFLAEADDLLVVDLVIAEVVYVLESFYRVERARVAELIRSIVAFDAIRVQDEGLILRSIEIYEEHRIDYAEAYLCGCAEGTAGSSVASFDRPIDRVATIIRVEPRDY